MAHETFKLPLSVVSLVDLKRIKRELDDINNSLLQMKIRQGGESQVQLPKTSRLLEDLVTSNNINLLHSSERDNLARLVDELINKAPVIHMSFSKEPTPKFLNKLLSWLRDSIDPYVLVTVGLAPTIGAGCIVRTQSRYFDLSLRQTLIDKKQSLLKELTAPQKVSPAALAQEAK